MKKARSVPSNGHAGIVVCRFILLSDYFLLLGIRQLLNPDVQQPCKYISPLTVINSDLVISSTTLFLWPKIRNKHFKATLLLTEILECWYPSCSCAEDNGAFQYRNTNKRWQDRLFFQKGRDVCYGDSFLHINISGFVHKHPVKGLGLSFFSSMTWNPGIRKEDMSICQDMLNKFHRQQKCAACAALLWGDPQRRLEDLEARRPPTKPGSNRLVSQCWEVRGKMKDIG